MIWKHTHSDSGHTLILKIGFFFQSKHLIKNIFTYIKYGNWKKITALKNAWKKGTVQEIANVQFNV